jgi:thioredoxin reductase (NADPH)
MQTDVYDITIIGGGPVGLYGAYYAGFRALRTQLIDSLGALGGQVTALYPEKWIYDVAGFPKIMGRELIANLVEQAGQYHPATRLDETVETLLHEEGGVLRLTSDRAVHRTRALLITAGIGAFHPKTFRNPAIDTYEGRGLWYFVPRFDEFVDKRVLIVGGGDSAVDWANGLVGVARSITLIHRRGEFRAYEDSVAKLMRSPVHVRTFYELRRLEGTPHLSRAVIFDNRTGEEETLQVDAIVASLGFTSTLGPLQEWGLDLESDSIRVNTHMETNVPGVYAAGDIVTYPGKVKLIASGFGEAATAVNNIAAYLNPKASLFPGHSSSQGIHAKAAL